MEAQLIFTNYVSQTIDEIADSLNPSGIFVIVDVNTESFVLPRLQSFSTAVSKAKVITVKAGDMNKNLDALQLIWRKLTAEGCTRNSLIINLGGGMVTDMGAFAASTFKRGVRFINVPTTLLGAVDASVGGKTGINFNNLKNQIGVFAEAEAVIISTTFFSTLTPQELYSGYAEMLKHALLSSTDELAALLEVDVTDIDPDALLALLEKSVMVKKGVVDQDPTEQNIRRALNLGHTCGHAFETFAMERKSPISHGYAVAYGLIPAMVLSNMIEGFDSGLLHSVASYIVKHYGAFDFSCDDYPRLLALMGQDKKNKVAGQINFTLLKAPGEPVIDCMVDDDKIKAALDITRDLMGL